MIDIILEAMLNLQHVGYSTLYSCISSSVYEIIEYSNLPQGHGCNVLGVVWVSKGHRKKGIG